jgi:hypothetical protein
MTYTELKENLKTAQAEVNRIRKLLKTTFPTLEEAQPGDKLEDGCVVIERQPKSILYNERLLIAAPEETEVWCDWTSEFKSVFDRLKEKRFNPSDWFIPSVEQLQLACKKAKRHFSHWYWSSDETSSTLACSVCWPRDTHYPDSKTHKNCVRAFRFIEL